MMVKSLRRKVYIGLLTREVMGTFSRITSIRAEIPKKTSVGKANF